MAKQTKSQTPAASSTDAAPAPQVPAVEKGLKDVFIRVLGDDGAPKPLEAGKKLAPQAQLILNTIEAAGAEGITREQLVKNLTGVIATRQPVGRIVTYYTKPLTVEFGLVRLQKVS